MAGTVYFNITNNYRTAIDGSILWTKDDGNFDVIAPQFLNSRGSILDNVSLVTLADATLVQHASIYGAKIAQMSQNGAVGIERGFKTLINSVCGPRESSGTNADNIAPWIALINPNKVSDSYIWNKIWHSVFTLDSNWAVEGYGNMIHYTLGSICLDPANLYGVPTDALTPPDYLGTVGLNLSNFAQMKLNSVPGSGGTFYDGFDRFQFSYNNNLIITPCTDPAYAQYRMPQACVAGQGVGYITIDQLANANNPLPRAAGTYTFTITIPSPDETHTLSIDLSVVHISNSMSRNINNLVTNTVTYGLFGTSSANGTYAAGWPIVAKYDGA